MTAQFVLLGLLILTPVGQPPARANEFAGLFYSIAVLLAVPAVINLRPSLTVMPEPKTQAPLITYGIYRWIRHPMYTALLCLAMGLAVSHWTVTGFVLVIVLAVVLTTKSRYEDRLLQQRWQQAQVYQQRTGAFWPRVRRSHR